MSVCSQAILVCLIKIFDNIYNMMSNWHLVCTEACFCWIHCLVENVIYSNDYIILNNFLYPYFEKVDVCVGVVQGEGCT